MAEKKFNELPAASAISGTELVPVMQNGITKQAAASLFIYDDTEIKEEIENKQNSTDENLETEDKTISGAINEIKQRLDSFLSIEGVEF